MSKRSKLPLGRYHVPLYQEDWDYLSRLFGPGSPNSSVGIAGAIREIVHAKVLGLKALENQGLDRLGPLPSAQHESMEDLL